MKILFITHYSQLYGANRSLFSVIEKCKCCRDEVCLLLPKKGDCKEELERKSIDYTTIPFFGQLFYYRKELKYLILLFMNIWTFLILPYIIYKVKRFKPDLIYSNTAAENTGIIIARILGIKHITHVREFMDLDHRLNFVCGNKAKKRYISKSDAVIYVSQSVAKHTLMGEDLPENHKVIYNGVRMPNIKYYNKNIPEVINFGIVGLLDESKGQDMAIRLFNKIKNEYPLANLHIWGDKSGDYKNSLIKLIEDLNLKDRVTMHGFEKNTDIVYSNMHVLLMCSKAEGFGRVTVEAMMRGIPVLGYDSGGTAEIVVNGYNGYVFSTEEEFIKKVHNIFSSDEHYNELCLNAFKDSRERFSEDLYTHNVKSFIDNLMQKI